MVSMQGGEMKPSQIAQLQDLNKCYMKGLENLNVEWELRYTDLPLTKYGKKWLRRLTHQYRNQIAAVKRNQRRQA
jgi:hypothetical protein